MITGKVKLHEFALGMPEVVVREIDGKKCEPVETVVVDIPQSHVGTVTQLLGDRRARDVAQAALGRGEHLDQRNILPLGNPWHWDPAQLNGSQAYRRQRLLDTMQFLYEQQCGFYDRYVAALRAATGD